MRPYGSVDRQGPVELDDDQEAFRERARFSAARAVPRDEVEASADGNAVPGGNCSSACAR